jgi:hypothetical protein
MDLLVQRTYKKGATLYIFFEKVIKYHGFCDSRDRRSVNGRVF